MVAYGEFRSSFNKDPNDCRILFYGIQYIIDIHIARRWTRDDLIRAETFCQTHNVGGTHFPFPKDLFIKVLRELLFNILWYEISLLVHRGERWIFSRANSSIG